MSMQDTPLHTAHRHNASDAGDRPAFDQPDPTMTRELHEALKARDRFLANMSHELRTPLNAILGYSDLLLSDPAAPLDGKHRDCLESIRQAGQHMLSLVSDILDYAKIQQARLSLSLGDCDAAEVVEQPIRLVSVIAADMGVHVRFQGAADVPVYCDLLRAHQVVTNILTNAVKVSPPGGNIVVAAWREGVNGGARTVLTVSDSGPGMTADQLEEAFEPFVQLEDPLRKTRGGTGLGLPLSRDLMRLHGGDLTVETTPGKGTTVRLCFPGAGVHAA